MEERLEAIQKELSELKLLHVPDPKKVLKSRPAVLKAVAKYYQKNKNNLDFRIKARDNNRRASAKRKKIREDNKNKQTDKQPEQQQLNLIIPIITPVQSLSLHDDLHSLGF